MTRAVTPALPAGLTPERFLRLYWQRRACVLRGALAGWPDPLQADELAGLACEPDVESRLVLVRGGRRPFEVVPGPQDAARLRRLPRSHWTLLVQEADRHVPALAELRARFAFVPWWRMDDVMVSFAPRGGTVGPHIDSYDVFLVQGSGRRRWQVEPGAPPDYRPGLDLRVLRRFRPRQEWLLEPGDVLYVPPGVAHCGVSLEDAFTYSIGFRAPSAAELALAVLQAAAQRADHERLYADAGLRPQRHPGQLAPPALAGLRALVRSELRRMLALEPGALDRLLGALLTEPKALAARPRTRPLDARAVRRRLRAGAALQRHPRSRLLFVAGRRGRHGWLCADGRAHELPHELAFAGPLLCDRLRPEPAALRAGLARRGFDELLSALLNAGALEWVARRER